MLGTETVHISPLSISKLGCIHTKTWVEGDVEVPFRLTTSLQRLPRVRDSSLSFPGVLEVAITLTSRSNFMNGTSLVSLRCIRVDALADQTV
jgi:hypothetical protein